MAFYTGFTVSESVSYLDFIYYFFLDLKITILYLVLKCIMRLWELSNCKLYGKRLHGDGKTSSAYRFLMMKMTKITLTSYLHD